MGVTLEGVTVGVVVERNVCRGGLCVSVIVEVPVV